MHLSLTTVQLIILVSSMTLASDYELPLHLASRQSSFFCLPVFLLYPGTWTTCGSGYISPDCSCCNGGEIGCLTLTQTCAVDDGVTICCDNTSPDCPSTSGGGESCASQGGVYCGGNGCLSAGYGCCPNDPNHGGCPLEQYCCNNPDGSPSCCVANPNSAAPTTEAALTTETARTSQAAPTSESAPTLTASANFGPTTSAKMTKNSPTSTATSGPSSPSKSSSSTRVLVIRAARGSHSFNFQSAIPFIVISYFLLIGIFA